MLNSIMFLKPDLASSSLKRLGLVAASFFVLAAANVHADITDRPQPLPPEVKDMTFKQRWKKFFKDVSNDVSMEGEAAITADAYRDHLINPQPQKLPEPDKKERKRLAKEAKERAKENARYEGEPSYRSLTPEANSASIQPPKSPSRRETQTSLPASPMKSGEILTATPSKKANRVKSPYEPYTELDATGLTSGSLAKDPVSGKVFRIP